MSNDLNLCQFIGRLGREPELRSLGNSGQQVAIISLAVGKKYTDKNTGQLVDKTEWVKVLCFGRLAEIAGEYLTKGSRIYVQGEFTTRQYEKDGQTHYVTEIRASEFKMLDSAPQQQSAKQQAPQQRQQQRQQGNQQRQANHNDYDYR